MLKSLRNHEAGSAACRHYHNQPDEMADCWCGLMQRKIKSLMMIKYIAIEFVKARKFGGPLSASVTPRYRMLSGL